MGSTLTNGIYLPAEGERNCYTGLAANWTALDSLIGGYNAHIGNATIHVTAEDKQAWNNHIADTVKHVTAEDKQAWNNHTGDTTIHVTAEDKQAWNGKADASALTAHTGDTTIHVTAEDKAKWDTVTGKANDADVVHKSGNETVGGNKTFSDRATFSTTSVNGEITLKQNGYDPATNGQSSVSGTYNFVLNARAVTNGSFGQLGFYGGPGFTAARFVCRYYTGANVYDESYIEYVVNGTSGSITGRSFKPSSNGLVDLGTSANKWKTFNGLEPSSLSLPSGNASDIIDISSYLSNLDGTNNTYVAPANGWITINMNNCTGIHATITGFWSDSRVRASAGAIKFLMPVIKNQTVTLTIHGGTINNARFIPCQGNV